MNLSNENKEETSNTKTRRKRGRRGRRRRGGGTQNRGIDEQQSSIGINVDTKRSSAIQNNLDLVVDKPVLIKSSFASTAYDEHQVEHQVEDETRQVKVEPAILSKRQLERQRKKMKKQQLQQMMIGCTKGGAINDVKPSTGICSKRNLFPTHFLSIPIENSTSLIEFVSRVQNAIMMSSSSSYDLRKCFIKSSKLHIALLVINIPKTTTTTLTPSSSSSSSSAEELFINCIEETVSSFHDFSIEITRLGFFNKKKQNVVWLGIDDNDGGMIEIQNLQKRVVDSLKNANSILKNVNSTNNNSSGLHDSDVVFANNKMIKDENNGSSHKSKHAENIILQFSSSSSSFSFIDLKSLLKDHDDGGDVAAQSIPKLSSSSSSSRFIPHITVFKTTKLKRKKKNDIGNLDLAESSSACDNRFILNTDSLIMHLKNGDDDDDDDGMIVYNHSFKVDSMFSLFFFFQVHVNRIDLIEMDQGKYNHQSSSSVEMPFYKILKSFFLKTREEKLE
jgi:hypothetical protein